ncbi:hypothetical protein [Arthrobacter sp.]|uniref:hypothetical protein n=1 Tax=Arthrobacter sp. TaxID=1667 RepID=UPI003A8F5F93
MFIPSALTWIFSSLHISVGFAITGAVVGEYLGASAGWIRHRPGPGRLRHDGRLRRDVHPDVRGPDHRPARQPRRAAPLRWRPTNNASPTTPAGDTP